MTTTTAPEVHYRLDYRVPPFLLDRIDLDFDLREVHTRVRARLELRRNPESEERDAPLVLDGEKMELVRAVLDGRELAPHEYSLDEEHLTIPGVPDRFRLETEVVIEPQENTALEGLYRSGGGFCTQCEAEGFRRITYSLDRPDVLARYTTTVRAEKARYPVLLSNGNPVAAGEEPDGRHWVRWEDPFPKPSYLFALVAGDLFCHEDRYTTASGREVALRLFVEHRNAGKTEHAMRSLKQAMRWDEEVYGREYDLDIYMIVAVDDFNMGAMENKGLNIFNSKCVLASPETATDDDYERIQGVVAHEYFHNWTGNRVTCRDWFQLSLKEGLTVFRDQEFTADLNSRPVKRIRDVTALRERQFPEDAGPMAHPVRPDSYIEMNNFYTATVYEKGAEVVRMMHTLLGPERFRAGTDLYFERFDGKAVTCDDFRQALQDASGVDLSRFERWYSQAGTPVVTIEEAWDPERGAYTLELSQETPPTPGQPEKLPVPIPFAMGLLGRDGRELPLQLEGESAPSGTTRVLLFTEQRQRFTFLGLPERPVLSPLRNFSAPVRLRPDPPEEQLALLMAHDSDPFNRWEAGQRFGTVLLLRAIRDLEQGREPEFPEAFPRALEGVLADERLDGALKAEALFLPGEASLAEELEVVRPDLVHAAREALRRRIARDLRAAFRETYERAAAGGPYRWEPAEAARRALRYACLAYLCAEGGEEAAALAARHYAQADNMTDLAGALTQLASIPGEARERALEDFHRRFRDDPLVLDRWFTIQATADLPDQLDRVEALRRHPDFRLENPNRVRSLVGAFAVRNPVWFHDPSGRGHRFVADTVLELDRRNPQIASRLVDPLLRWRRFDAPRAASLREQLERIAATEGLSKDVYEKVSRALED